MSSNRMGPHQSPSGDPAPYELKLAGAIEEIFGRGTHDLSGVLVELNGAGLSAPDGRPWTEESFVAEMHRLGA